MPASRGWGRPPHRLIEGSGLGELEPLGLGEAPLDALADADESEVRPGSVVGMGSEIVGEGEGEVVGLRVGEGVGDGVGEGVGAVEGA